MKLNKSLLLAFGLLVLSASLYRAWPDRPYGFAPQMAMALFGGAVIKDKRWAFILPLLSMLLSDLLYQGLYMNGLTTIKGFYTGQWLNYLLIAGITLFGFLLKKINFLRVTAFSLTGSILFFLTSNFVVWLGGGGYNRPKTFDGLMMCFADGLPFYGNSVAGTLFFSALFFGGYYLIRQYLLKPKLA